MKVTPSKADDNSQPTLAGCLLMVFSLAVIGGVALLLVTWRDPNSGQALPQKVAIVTPVLAGALSYAIGSWLLRILGLRVEKPKKELSDRPNDFETAGRDGQTWGEPDPAAGQPRDDGTSDAKAPPA
jgi:hypothetical protein